MESVGVWLVLGLIAVAGAVKAWQAMPKEPNAHIRCPHCGTTGQVWVHDVVRKKGISGGKATGAIVTGGASLLATGLSRKEGAKHLRCAKCQMEWDA